MIELAACTVMCYKALRSAAARSASMRLLGTFDYVRSLARRYGAHAALHLHACGEDPGLILAAGAADYDELFSWVQRVWGGL